MTTRLCGQCRHPGHWRECRAEGCYCRKRGPGGYFLIAGETDPLDDEPLYWSNADGWVSRDTADVYDSQDGNLPIGGRWVDADPAIRTEG